MLRDLTNMAIRNVSRKKTRTLIVVLALGLSIALVMSIYTGVKASESNTEDMTNTIISNTEDMIDSSISSTQDMINQTIIYTQNMIDTVNSSTQDLINETISDTQEMINKTMENIQAMQNETDMQLTRIDVSNMTTRRPPTYSPIPEVIIENISSMDNVDQVIPIIQQSYGANLRNPGPGGGPGGGIADYVVNGVPLDPYLEEKYHLLPFDIINGSTITENDTSMVLIHEDLQDYFDAGVGDTITIEDTTFTVKGIYYSAIQNNTVYMSIDDARSLLGFGEGQANYLYVYTENISVVDNVADEIRYYYPDFDVEPYKDSATSSTEYLQRILESQIEQLNEDAENQVNNLEENRDNQIKQLEEDRADQILQSEEDMNDQIKQLEENQENQVDQIERDEILLSTIGNIIIVISTITASLIIFFMMFYTIKERTREIGVFKALGFTKGSIVEQFLIEGTIFGFLGGAIGVIIAWIIGPILSDLLLPNLDVYTTSNLNFQLIVLALGFTALLGAFSSLYPAWSASRKSPTEAMRNE